MMEKLQLLKWIRTAWFIIFLFCGIDYISAQEENLNVMERWIEWSDGRNMLIHHLNDKAFAMLDIRDKEIAGLKTEEDWINRQKKVKKTLMKIVGPFPDKTPLNAKVTGVDKKEGYKIEKIIYESIPGFCVTGCLFIPDAPRGKKPAILNVIGHTDIAFRSEGYQKMILHLVQKGFIVFAIDPISQGERSQYYDNDKKKSVIGMSVPEHSYFGNQCLINGVSSGRYFIWDGIRGIDYLISRKEVDPERIGVTGISGGGTLTAYISAFDERVKASAPTCYITGFRRLLESIGSQDAEQNIFHAVKNGITHADFILARAPKPTLMVTTTRDFFSIQGARETYNEVLEAYKAFGKGEDLSMVEDDDGHALTAKNNTATCAFFQKYLNMPGDPSPGEINILNPGELTVTTTGQISSHSGGETVFSINARETMKLVDKINDSRKNPEKHLAEVLTKAKELSGYTAYQAKAEPVFRGRYKRDGYSVEMYALQGQGNCIIPLLLFVPETGSNFASVIYLHPQGKITDAAPGGRIEQLVKKGYLVAAADVLGTGEVAPDNSFWGAGYFISTLTGISLPGIQAGDVGIVVDFLKSRKDIDQERIGAMAFDEMCPSLLHAAAFNKSLSCISLIGSLVSYRSAVLNQFYEGGFVKNFVPGALSAYDLPDLIGCVAPRRIVLVELKDQMKQIAAKELVDEELKFPLTVYSQQNAANNIVIMPHTEDISSIADKCFIKK